MPDGSRQRLSIPARLLGRLQNLRGDVEVTEDSFDGWVFAGLGAVKGRSHLGAVLERVKDAVRSDGLTAAQ
jgi:hypothetical protein